MRVKRMIKLTAGHISVICSMALLVIQILDWYNPFMDFMGHSMFLRDTNWEVLESQEDQAVDAKGLRQSPEMVRLQRELTGLGYHFTVLLDEKRLYSNLSEEEFRQVEQLIGPNQEQAKSINVSSDRVSVIKCSFYEDEEECAIIAVNIGMDNPLGSKSYLQRYVLPYIWIFGLSMILVVILVNVCCSKWISSLILPPMKEIRKGMQKVKKGELEGNIRVLRNDELGEVCSEFNEMQLWLKKSKEEQMKYETYRRELISGVSHDLRTPLTTIKGYVGGILDGIANTEEKRRKYLLAVQTRTADLENLIDQLSSYNRMENHMFQYKMEETALKKAVEDYLEENEEFIVENRLIVSLEADTDGTMRMDQRAFKRIMDNLFTNSIRYREKGQSRIRISIKKSADTLFWSIGDDGPGVAEGSLEKIFESFFRLDESRAHCSEGSGLGLAIVKRIVLDHHGIVYARNRDGLEICMEFPES